MNQGRNWRGTLGRLLDMESDLQRGEGIFAFIICKFLTLGLKGSRTSGGAEDNTTLISFQFLQKH